MQKVAASDSMAQRYQERYKGAFPLQSGGQSRGGGSAGGLLAGPPASGRSLGKPALRGGGLGNGNIREVGQNIPSGSSASTASSHGINSKFLEMIQVEAARQGVSPKLVKAIVKTESGGRSGAQSPAGALGLMQLMPATANALGVDPLIPQENISGGIRYLKEMAQRFGSLDLTLAAYNAGPKAVERYGGIPPYSETQNYIRKVRKLLNR